VKKPALVERQMSEGEGAMNEEMNRPVSTADLAYGRQEDNDGAMQTPETQPAHDERVALLDEDRSSRYSGRWQDVQARFVDDPRSAVSDADGLVAEIIQQLATSFAEQRQNLEGQWSKGSEVSTVDLRQAMMLYRSFFLRLLAA
jgi:hypothetical protein